MRTPVQAPRRSPLRLALPVRVLVVALAAVTLSAQGRPIEPRLQGEGALKVMTYNLYAGSEYSGLTDPSYPNFLQAVTNLMLEARASDPPARMQAVAHQIAAVAPHLVSLQEVASWSTGPTPGDQTVEFDFLQLLLEALDADGMAYAPVASLTHFDVTVPGTIGYVRNTWRVVVLARADLEPEDFFLANIDTAPWSNAATWKIPLPALGADCQSPRAPGLPYCILPFPRGWVSADVFYRGKTLRFVAAHLDSRAPNKNLLQGPELLAGPANTERPVVVAADLNCDLADPADPSYPTCQLLLDTGFVDGWSAANPSEPGFTKDLPVMTRRSDYVMARGPFGVQAAALLGEESADRTPTGQYASNHAGVVARLQLPDK